VRIGDIRFLFEFDRWATRRVLATAQDVDEATWSAPNAIGERGLGGILVHQLGAHQRWRHDLSGRTGPRPRPEDGPLPTPTVLRATWHEEWADLDVWLDTLDDAWLAALEDDVPHWQMLAHVVNHGTQHRSEAAVLLTSVDRSPGDLDMIDYAEAVAQGDA
jgi:uncharacterized damage-inducible protein DinB